jgi:hypothetical protein
MYSRLPTSRKQSRLRFDYSNTPVSNNSAPPACLKKNIIGLVASLTLTATVLTVVLVLTLKTKQSVRIDPALVSAYETISAAAPEGYNVVLVGHDPLSIGYQEGLMANAPWALDLWYSTRPQAGGNAFTNETEEDLWRPWSPWSDDIIASDDPLYINIHNRSDLFLSNTPFYLSENQYNSFPTKVRKAIDLWNNLNVRAYINDYYVATFNKNYPEPEGGKVLHKVGLISDEDIETLKTWGYGFPYSPDSPYGMHVYGDNCHGGKTRRISGSNSWAKCPDWFWLSDKEKAVSCHSGTYCCCLKGRTQWQTSEHKCGSKGCHV